MEYVKIYKNIMKELEKINDNDEKFDNLFLVTCLLIYNMSCQGKQLDRILQLLNEFDYNKNFKGE